MCIVKDGNELLASFQNIYPKELKELKVEHQGNYALFLDFDIKLEHSIFLYKLVEKRDKFPFFFVRMPHMSSNIPSSIFYGSIFSKAIH